MALTDSLIAYYALSDTADAVGSNTLTNNNGVTFTAGKISNAASFTAASGQYLSRADNADLSTGDIDFTVNFWLKGGDLSASSGFPFLAGKGWLSDNNANEEWCILQEGSGQPLSFYVAAGAVQTGLANSNGGALSSGVWYMVTAWHDSVNNVMGIALNAGTPNTSSYSGGVNDGNRAFILGARSDGSLPWDGMLDEFGFWKRVLTSQERTDLYNAGAGLAYPFSGGGGVTAHDLTLLGCGN